MKHRIAFFDTKPYDKLFFNNANKEHLFEIKFLSDHLNPETAELTRGCDVVCAFVNDKIDKDTIMVLKKNGVQLIALRCAGYNNVDLKAAFNAVHIVRVPAYSPHAVAEHAMALVLCLNRKIHRAYNRVRDGNFTLNGLLGFDLYGKTAGVVGTGKIGKCLIAILKGFGMRILAYDAFPDEVFAKEQGISYVDLPQLCQEADIISLHCPLTPQTHHLVNEKMIVGMKDGVFLINTGRGELIDTQALIEGLKNGKVGAAGLDVYEEEGEYFFEDFSSSVISDDVLARLLTFPNVLITAHQGFFTEEAMHNIAVTTMENIKDFFMEKKIPNEICYKCSTNACPRKTTGKCF
ncbi:MAG: 2-hydroxyacid dehydrogenase [Candidatus Omnitrophota bacterium]